MRTYSTIGGLLVIGLIAGCSHAAGTKAPETTARPDAAPANVVTAEDIERAPTQPIEQVLMARVPGIIVMRTPDGGLAIRIRGVTSFEARKEPLYVINGIPIEPGPYGSLTGINPYDIESIEVLKDAANTAMYGVRGAHGVILITTKTPGQ